MSAFDDAGWVAFVATDTMSFGRNVKLMLGRRTATSIDVARITSDGLVLTSAPEGETLPSAAAIELPVDALNAIAKAIEVFQGDTGHAATEVRVLREILGKEQARVDKMLETMLGVD